MNYKGIIEKYEKEYIDFMGIKSFPKYKICTRTVSLEVAETQGYEAVAQVSYNVDKGEHVLTISDNILIPKYVLFHEYTHIYDSEMYVDGDKIRYCGLTGYTEYHASQVELLQLLGCEAVKDTFEFSMNDMIDTISGEKSVYEYVKDKHNHAIKLFSRNDFSSNIEILKSAIGVLYNYLGLRSICEMYATDYVEEIDNNAFLNHISSIHFGALNVLMHRWLGEKEIELSINLYNNIIFSLVRGYRL